MNANPNSVVELDKNNTEVVHEADDGITEVGAVVAETKGGVWGFDDNGGGLSFAAA